MAAGSSAPELATVIIGVFFAKDDIGVSGVIGSGENKLPASFHQSTTSVFSRVQHHVCYLRLLSLLWNCHSTQLVAVGARLHVLLDFHFNNVGRHLQRNNFLA